MFVKIIFNNGQETIYETTDVHVSNYTQGPNGKDIVGFDFETERQPVHLEIDKDVGTEVYLMNNEGRTIDVYRWPVDRPNPVLP